MKKYIIISIIPFLIGALLFTSVGVLASQIFARDISYKSTNVESALNDLYSKVNNGFDSNSLYLIIDKKVVNSSTSIVSNNWNSNNGALVLNTNDKGEHSFYIPFKVSENGRYELTFSISKNEQENSSSINLYYGISDTPKITFSSYNIANFQGSGAGVFKTTVNLSDGNTYYLGAVDKLTYKDFGWSRVTIDSIIITKID